MWERAVNLLLPSPYVLMNGLGFIAALLLADRRLLRSLPHRRDTAYVLLVVSVLVGWFGAHVLAWVVSSQPFSRAGFVFYGGVIAALAFLAVAALGLKLLRLQEFLVTLNAAVVPLLVAHGLGRVGCFFAGCCYGAQIPGTSYRHPTQLYESGFLFLLAWAIVRRGNQPMRLPSRDIAMYLAVYPIFRFLIEFLRDDPRGQAFGLSTSQWISLPLAVVGCVLVIRNRRRAGRTLEWSVAPNS